MPLPTQLTIGSVQFQKLPFCVELSQELSLSLENEHPLGRDCRLLAEKLGIALKCVNYLRRNKQATLAILLECWKGSLEDLVHAIRLIKREDCVEQVKEVIVKYFNDDSTDYSDLTIEDILNLRKDILPGQSFARQSPTDCHECRYPITPIIMKALTALFTMLQTEMVFVGRAIDRNIKFIMSKYIIRRRTDDGFKSFVLSSLTTAERFVLIFLIFNDIVVMTPVWETVHAFSILEHLVVILPVYGAWFMEPKIKKLYALNKKKSGWNLLRRMGSFEEENMICRKQISELEDEEKSEMGEIRKALFCILPSQFMVLIACFWASMCDTDQNPRCLKYQSDFFLMIIFIHLVDFCYKVILFYCHYITLDLNGRFHYTSHDLETEVENIRKEMNAEM
ncbi:uncharacterized protein LOC144447547 [Glandiceps talaboti]